MEDRRKEPRRKIMAFLPVHDKPGALLGYLANLTKHGAMVIGEKPQEINTPVTLVIEFPDELLAGIVQELIIASRVARCVPDEEGSQDLKIGFEFTEMTPQQMQLIEILLDRYHFRHREWERKEGE